MNKHTRAVLNVLKESIDCMEIDSEVLNDSLNSALGNDVPDTLDSSKIDQAELRAQLVKYLAKKALKTADEMLGLVQQVYDL